MTSDVYTLNRVSHVPSWANATAARMLAASEGRKYGGGEASSQPDKYRRLVCYTCGSSDVGLRRTDGPCVCWECVDGFTVLR